MPLNEQAKVCGARTRGGKKCLNPAVTGSDFCRVHVPPELPASERPGRQGVKHGAYARGVVTPEEAELYDEAFTSLKRDFKLKLAADQMQAATAALHWAKWNMAVKANAPDLIAHYDRLFSHDLECLKATREKRDGVESKQTTPAEWAADIVEKEKKRRAERESASNSGSTQGRAAEPGGGRKSGVGGDPPSESSTPCGQPTNAKP